MENNIDMNELNMVYRVVKLDELNYEVWQTYENKQGEIVGWIESARSLWGVSETDLKNSYKALGQAFKLKVIEKKELDAINTKS